MKKSLLLTSLLMLFVSFISLAQPSNDNIANAIDVSSLINGCSSDQAFTNVAATSDSTLATCGSPSGSNVWFKFQATDTIINILVDRGGSKGSILNLVVVLFDSTITPLSQLACKPSLGQYDDVDVDYLQLTIGEWYYFSVDNELTTAGTFTLCLSTTASYDFYEGAVDVSAIMDSVSLDAQYTTSGATGDLMTGSCNDAGDYNRWFKFVATATDISILVDRGGSKGGLRKANIALWEDDGTTEVACSKYIGQYDDVTLSGLGLTIGNTYYFSVDNFGSTNRGSFTIGLSTVLDYDFYSGAKDVSYLFTDTCSANSEFTTIGATSDLSTGSCNDAGDFNRWFKFQATAATVNVLVKRGGVYGGIRKVNLALWDSTGTNEISCSKYIGQYDFVDLNALTLTIGDWYYISVDNFGSTNRGSFTLCLSDEVNYDFYQGAKDVSSLINSCSPDAAYSTQGATSDMSTGSCSDAGDYNRWFKFQATTSELTIKVDRGGVKGGLRKANLVLWEADGTTEVACAKYVGQYDDVVIEDVSLTIGDWYYISVDNADAASRGTFTLCLLTYDSYLGAKDVTSLINGCSADAEYSTVGATPDMTAGSCSNAGSFNRWFKFQASETKMSVLVNRGGTKGTIQRINAVMWEADGTTEVSCNRYVSNTDSVYVESNSLVIGNWYYISVDNNYYAYQGSFTLCLDTALTYDYFEGAEDITAAYTTGCTPDAAYSTIGATADLGTGSCSDAGSFNRWFKFQAAGSNVNATIKRGGSFGTIQRVNAVIWEADGVTELACKRYVSNTDEVNVEASGLVAGDWYYLSVDNNYYAYRGSFTVCLDTTLTYDYFEGAIDITNLIDSCSADAEYTTIGATADLSTGSCGNAGDFNRWFKFVANSTHMNVTVQRGGALGSIQRVNTSIWEADGVSEVACNRYVSNTDVVEVGALGLVVGDTYYVSVDNNYYAYRGTFTMCLDTNLSYDYYEGAIDVSSTIGSCSNDAEYTTIGATADLSTGTCSNAGDFNRWFKFKPTTTSVNVKIDRGGTKGTIQRVNVSIWEADGQSEVACNRYVNNTDVVEVAALGLDTTEWYYISVDNNYYAYRGSFTLCIDTTVNYDYYEGAKDITSFLGSCTPDAAYTTIGATADLSTGTCSDAGDFNRWFKFQATGPELSLTVDRGGAKGTIQRVNVVIWEADGQSEVSCNRYVSNTDVVTVDATGLVTGDWYYVSVDNNYYAYRGSFTLCLDTTPSYDFYAGAIELTDLNSYCSPDAAYSTIGATADMATGTCNNAGDFNRWFKFTAVDSVVTYTIKRGATLGTIQRINTTLWEADGSTQVACARYVSNTDDVTITDSNLTPGNVYYISVDNNYYAYRGTFTICINNVGAPFYSRADGNWNTPATWSNDSIGGAAALTAPGIGSIVYVDGNAITLSSNDTCAEVNIDVTKGVSSLIMDGATLTVMGTFNQVNSGHDSLASVSLINNGSLYVNDNYSLMRNGGAVGLLFTAATGSNLGINQNLVLTSNGGTLTDNVMTFDGSSVLAVAGDVSMNHITGMASKLVFNGTSTGTVLGNFSMSATADGKVEVDLNTDAVLTLDEGVTKGSPAYGIINSIGNSTINFNGAATSAHIPESKPTGTTDEVTYNDVIITAPNPTVVYTLSGSMTINGTLTLGLGAISIPNTTSLTVEESITNNGTITVQDGGALVQNTLGANTNSGTGTYMVKQTGTSDVLTYNVWSSPIQSANILASFTGTNPCDIYAFEADSQAFKYDYVNGFSTTCLGNPVSFGSNDVLQGGDGIADVARGYFIPNGSSANKSFTGDVNNGDLSTAIVTTNIVNDPTWNGNDWNLIGNPYPSGLSAMAFWNENAVANSRITDAIYFWDVNEYASWNLSGGVSNGAGSSVTPNGSIGVAQGFFVVASTSTTVTYDNSMRNDTNDQFFKTEIENHNVWVNVKTPSGEANTILVGYTNDATNGFDPLYDAHKLSGNAFVRFSSMLNNEEFVIQSFAPLSFGGQKVIPLTVFTAETGTHTFSEVKRENIGTGMTIFLRDTKTGMEYDLTKGDYTVELDANTTNTRFELVFTNNDAATSVKETVKSNYLLLTTGEGYILQNDEGINGDIQVIDVTGKVIWTKNNVNSNQVNIDLTSVSSGLFIIQVINNNERVYTNKIVNP